MTLSEFYTHTSYALRGIDEDAPTHGDDEAIYWLSVLNSKKSELYQDVTKNWTTTFEVTTPNEAGTVATTATTALTGTDTYFTDYAVGDTITVSGETVRTIATIVSDTSLTVTVAFSNTASAKTFTRGTIIQAGVATYSLNRSFLGLSGDDSVKNGGGSGVYINTTAGTRVDLPFLTPEQRTPNYRNVYISGLYPQVLTFSDTIGADEDIVGGTLVTPGYYMPADLSATTDVLPFLDPNWAVLAVASEIAFNDITYGDKAPDLNVKANNLLSQMLKRNSGTTFNNPQPIPYNVKRIRDTRVN